MKRLLLAIVFGVVLAASSSEAQAQVNGSSYKTAGGLRIDVGDGASGFGLNVKHFLTSTGAIDANLIFFDGGAVGLGGEYQYNGNVNGASGLKYYAGIGPNFIFGNNNTEVQIRPVLGLDYKIMNAPLNFAFDWRPSLTVTDGPSEAGRFGISVRFAFK